MLVPWDDAKKLLILKEKVKSIDFLMYVDESKDNLKCLGLEEEEEEE